MTPPILHEILVNFRVHAPNASPRDRVWLLGSAPELGEWNPARAIETGQVAGEWKVWQATVRLPVEAAFQWGWCRLTVDGRLRNWESMDKRERRLACYSGTLHTEWGDTCLEIFQQNMGSAELMTVKKTKRGDVVAVLGSSLPLGAWDPAKAVVATEFPRRSGRWSVTVFFDAGTLQEWNWVIIEEVTKQVKLMEKYTTRSLHDTHGWIKLNVPWGKKEAIVDWANKDYTGGGDTYVGTVELLKARRSRQMEIRRWEEAAEIRRRGKTVQAYLPSPPVSGARGSAASSASSYSSSSAMTTKLGAASDICPIHRFQLGMITLPPVPDKDFDSSVELLREKSDDLLHSPERTSSKTAAESFAEFTPLLKIKPYGDETAAAAAAGKQQKAQVEKKQASTKTATPGSGSKPATSPVADRTLPMPQKGSKPPQTPPDSKVSSSTVSGKTINMKLNVKPPASDKGGKPTLEPSRVSLTSESDVDTGAPPSDRKKRTRPKVDMSALGFKGDKPSEDARKSLVSEPGKPGYPRSPKTSEDQSARRLSDQGPKPSNAGVRSPTAHISPGAENYMCYTVQGREPWARTNADDTVPVMASSSWGSAVGMLYDRDPGAKPRSGSHRLLKLQEMTQQREQTRAVERMESIRQREERNRNKFHADQKFVLATAAAYPRSPPGGSPTRGGSLTRKSEEEEEKKEATPIMTCLH